MIKINGRGWPNHLSGQEFPLDDRLTAVADVLAALIEDMPQRPGLDVELVLKVLREIASVGDLNSEVVGHDHQREVDETRRLAQAFVCRFFSSFNAALTPRIPRADFAGIQGRVINISALPGRI